MYAIRMAIPWDHHSVIRCRNITYHGYGIVGTTTGGKCGIWTHGTLLFFGFQDRCNKPDSANFPCGIPSRTRTYRTWILSPVCLPVSSWGYGAVGRIRTSEAISDRFTVCCLYPSWLQRHGSWGKTIIARCSTIELPKNKCNHLMCGRFEQPFSHCVRYSTVELTHDYCVAHIVKHSMATFYHLR